MQKVVGSSPIIRSLSKAPPGGIFCSAKSSHTKDVPSEQPELIVKNVAAWHAWLRKNHGDPVGLWLVIAKNGTVEPTSLSYDQALEEALCHGWIDGQSRPRDDATYKQRFTQRRTRSAWSKRNVGDAERLLVDVRMRPARASESA